MAKKSYISKCDFLVHGHIKCGRVTSTDHDSLCHHLTHFPLIQLQFVSIISAYAGNAEKDTLKS